MSPYHERTGADGSIMYCCTHCFRIELSSYEGWLWHLGSREHQTANMRSDNPFFDPTGPRRSEMLRRCVDVHGILGLKARQILDYFKTWGEIEDFSYWYKNDGEDGQAVRCVVFYKEHDAAQACIKEGTHELEEKKLSVELYKPGSYRPLYERRRGGGRGRRGRGGYGGYTEPSNSGFNQGRGGRSTSGDSGYEGGDFRKRKSLEAHESYGQRDYKSSRYE